MKVLIAGWFSFEGMGATAGDLLCRDLTAKWLSSAGVSVTIANAAPFSDGGDWTKFEPDSFTHLIFVCGPIGNGWPVTEFMQRFRHCRKLGVNLSMLERLEDWNPFDWLLERDSNCAVRPDMTFLTAPQRVPVIGRIQAHHQKEYGSRARHHVVHEAFDRLLAGREAAVVPIDTRLDVQNAGGLRTAAEVESLIARMDAVVTTRLHGTVLALKCGVPPVVVDPISGGAKIARQVEGIGWPVWFDAGAVTDVELATALDYCLSEDARQQASLCRDQAQAALVDMKRSLLAALDSANVTLGVPG